MPKGITMKKLKALGLFCLASTMFMGLQSCEESYEEYVKSGNTPENPGNQGNQGNSGDTGTQNPGKEIPEDLYSESFASWIDGRHVYGDIFFSPFTNYSGDAYYAGMEVKIYSSIFQLKKIEFDGYYGSQATQLEITSAVFEGWGDSVKDVPGRVEIKSANCAYVYPIEPLEFYEYYDLKLTYREVVYNGTSKSTVNTDYKKSKDFYNSTSAVNSFGHITAKYPHDVLYLKEYPEIFYSSSRDLSSLFNDGKKPLFRFTNRETNTSVYAEGEMRVGDEVKTPDTWSEVALALDKVELQKGANYKIDIYAYTEGEPYEKFVQSNQSLNLEYVYVSKYDYNFEAVENMKVEISVLHKDPEDYDYFRYSFESDNDIDTDLMTVALDLQNTWWYTSNFPDGWVSKAYRSIRNEIVDFSNEAYREQSFLEDRKLPAYKYGNYPIMFNYTIPGRNIVTSTSSKDVYYYPVNEEEDGEDIIVDYLTR